MKLRHKKLLEELPKNQFKVKPSAIKAGYSPEYADSNPKGILKGALRAQAKEILEISANSSSIDTKDMKKTLAELVGYTREDVFKRIKSIGDNEKDLGSALKVLLPLAKDLGVNLTEDTPKTIVPILNIGVKQVEAIEDSTNTPIDGSVEP